MSNPLVHAERAAKRWGGIAADYLPLHGWFDATKGHVPDNRHRMVLHNAFGILLAEQAFGAAIVNSSGRRVFVRDLGVHHVLEDLGFVPTLADCLSDLPLLPWMAGHRHLRPVRIAERMGILPIGSMFAYVRPAGAIRSVTARPRLRKLRSRIPRSIAFRIPTKLRMPDSAHSGPR